MTINIRHSFKAPFQSEQPVLNTCTGVVKFAPEARFTQPFTGPLTCSLVFGGLFVPASRDVAVESDVALGNLEDVHLINRENARRSCYDYSITTSHTI